MEFEEIAFETPLTVLTKRLHYHANMRDFTNDDKKKAFYEQKRSEFEKAINLLSQKI